MNHSDDEQIIYLYDELRFSLREVAKLVYWSPNYVRNRLLANGIELRPRGGNKLPPPNPDLLRIAVYLYRRGLTAAEVGERMGIAEVTALRYLDRAGEPRRNNRNGTCKRGHKLEEGNVIYYDGGKRRRCLTCKKRLNREHARRYRARRKAESG